MEAPGAQNAHQIGRGDVLAFAGRRAEPAVSILMPVEQPLAAHPEAPLRLRNLVTQAVDLVASWWGTEIADAVRARIDNSDTRLEARGETAHGLAVLATPAECTVLRLPFTVDEQVVVNRTFATRQLFEGIARTPQYRVLVLAGHDAELFEGSGPDLVEVQGSGFPLHVEPPREWDTPHRDLPIREEARAEQQRVVLRAVDAALDDVARADRLPLVVAAPTRELAFFDEVTRHGDLVVGRVQGSFARSGPKELAAAVAPAVEEHRRARESVIVERLREAHGREASVVGLPQVLHAAKEGRGHLLVVEQRFTFPVHWVDGLTPGEGPDEQLAFDDLVDETIEAVLLAGGDVEFAAAGALDDLGHIGLLLRY